MKSSHVSQGNAPIQESETHLPRYVQLLSKNRFEDEREAENRGEVKETGRKVGGKVGSKDRRSRRKGEKIIENQFPPDERLGRARKTRK